MYLKALIKNTAVQAIVRGQFHQINLGIELIRSSPAPILPCNGTSFKKVIAHAIIIDEILRILNASKLKNKS